MLDDDLEKIGALVRDCADEQAAVRDAVDGEAFGRRVLVRDEPLGCGDEVVKDVLLAKLRPGLVPLLAVLAAAPHVRRRIDETLFEKRETRRTEVRRRRDVEAAVAVEHRRVSAVELQSFFVNEEHGNARAVLARVEDLFGLVVRRLEARNFGRVEDGGVARGDVVAIDRRREVEGREGVEDYAVVLQSAEAARDAGRW